MAQFNSFKREEFSPNFTREKTQNGYRICFYAYVGGQKKRICRRQTKNLRGCRNEKEIHRKLDLIEEEYRMELWQNYQDYLTACNSITVIELMDRHFAWVVETKSDKTIYNWRSYYRCCQKSLTSPQLKCWENENIALITRDKAKQYISKMQLKHEWSGASTTNYLAYLKSMFNYAVEMSLIANNPFKDVKVSKKNIKGKRLIVSEELQSIYNHLYSCNIPFLFYLQLIYSTHARRVELLRLKVKDFDLQKRRIVFSEDITKNKVAKTVQLPESLESLLVQYLETVKFDKANQDDYIFSQDFRIGDIQMYDNYPSECWRKMCRELNISDDCKMYALKKTGMVENLNNGITMNNVRNQAGHEKADMTAYYTHIGTENSYRELREKGVVFGV